MIKALINLDLPEHHLQYLKDKYPQIFFTVCADREKTFEHLKDTEVFIIFFLCTKRMLEAAPKLKWVQAISAGVDYIATDEIQQRGILLTNGRGIAKIHMAEYAFAHSLFDIKKPCQMGCLSNWTEGGISTAKAKAGIKHA